MRRRHALPAGAVLAVLVLSGCASLPTSGSIGSGGVIGTEDRGVRSCPTGPRAGDSPDEVVRGLLRAGACFDDNHAVARSFLTEPLRLAWRPDAAVTVVPDRVSVAVAFDGVPLDEQGRVVPPIGVPTVNARVTSPVLGTVDSAGRWSEAEAGASTAVDVALVREDAEWRVAALPDGLLLTQDDVDRVYRVFDLYFADSTRTRLVPDPRVFPSLQRQRPVPTAVVRALLEGPSPYLAPAVVTGAPPGARLAIDSVPLESGGVASVDLDASALDAGPDDRLLLLAQLQASLRQVSGVTGVRLTVEGAELVVPGARPVERGGLLVAPDVASRLLPAASPGDLVMVVDGRLARLARRSVVPLQGLTGLEASGPAFPGVTPAGIELAYGALVNDRSRLLVASPGAVPRELIAGADLTAPSFDRHGWVFSTPANAGAVIAARVSDGVQVVLPAPGLVGRRAVSVRASPDGARLLLLSTSTAADGTEPRVDVMGVSRTAEGRPTALGGPLRVAPRLDLALDATWSGDDEVAFLGGTGPAATAGVVTVRLGTPAQTLGGPAPQGSRTLTGDGDDIVVGVLPDAAPATVQRRVGATWVRLADAASPSFPG